MSSRCSNLGACLIVDCRGGWPLEYRATRADRFLLRYHSEQLARSTRRADTHRGCPPLKPRCRACAALRHSGAIGAGWSPQPR